MHLQIFLVLSPPLPHVLLAATAWDPAGFCCDHKGLQPDEDPTESMPTNAKEALVCCCFALFAYVIDLCDADVAINEKRHNKLGVLPSLLSRDRIRRMHRRSFPTSS